MFDFNIYYAFFPLKSSFFVNKLNSKDPKLKISDLCVNGLPLKTEGSTQLGVPDFCMILLRSLFLQARPRSAKHTQRCSLSRIKIFSGFISRCNIFLQCIKSKASKSCCIIYLIIVSLTMEVSFAMKFCKQPYSAYFKIRCNELLFLYTPQRVIIFSQTSSSQRNFTSE